MKEKSEEKNQHRWNEVCPEFEKLFGSSDLMIRTLTEMESPAKVLIEDMFFDGADILHCLEGEYEFSFRDKTPVRLVEGETLIIYPRNYVTIEAKAGKNRLLYGIFGGASIDSYLTNCGLYDGVHGKAAPQYASFYELRRLLESGSMDDPKARLVCLGLMHDMVRSIKDDLRRHGDTLLFDAVKQIQDNLHKRIVRVDDLCRMLHVSRSHLNKTFQNNGLPTPAEYIRREQLRLARGLLSESRLSINEIAFRLGFKSSSHFNQFIRRLTGRKPGELRNGT